LKAKKIEGNKLNGGTELQLKALEAAQKKESQE
jgi:hypothetical protein